MAKTAAEKRKEMQERTKSADKRLNGTPTKVVKPTKDIGFIEGVRNRSGIVKPIKDENNLAKVGPKVIKKGFNAVVDFLSPKKSYKVKSGDTLSQIAKKNGTTIAAIMKANPSIKDANKIRLGQKINFTAGKAKNPYKGMSKDQMTGRGSNVISEADKKLMKSEIAKSRKDIKRAPGVKAPKKATKAKNPPKKLPVYEIDSKGVPSRSYNKYKLNKNNKVVGDEDEKTYTKAKLMAGGKVKKGPSDKSSKVTGSVKVGGGKAKGGNTFHTFSKGSDSAKAFNKAFGAAKKARKAGETSMVVDGKKYPVSKTGNFRWNGRQYNSMDPVKKATGGTTYRKDGGKVTLAKAPARYSSTVIARSGATPDAKGLAREKAMSNKLDGEMDAFKKRAAKRKKATKRMAGGKVKKENSKSVTYGSVPEFNYKKGGAVKRMSGGKVGTKTNHGTRGCKPY